MEKRRPTLSFFARSADEARSTTSKPFWFAILFFFIASLGLLHAGSLAGYVYDASTGLAISGATVDVIDNSTGTVVGSNTTDAAGFFNVTSLASGYYNLTASQTGYYNQTRGTVKLNTSDPLLTDILLPPAWDFKLSPIPPAVDATLSGYVRDNLGAPLFGATVTVYQGGLPVGTNTSDGTGYYIIYLPGATGLYNITANMTGYSNSSRFMVRIDASNPMYQNVVLDFTLSPLPSGTGSIAGKVVDAGTGAPIVGAFVQVINSTGSPVGNNNTDATGTFIVYGLTTDKYRLDVSAAGYGSKSLYDIRVDTSLPAYTNVVLPASISLQMQTSATGSLYGYVYETNGTPIAGATVLVNPGGLVATTLANGYYQINVPVPQMSTVTAGAANHDPQTRTNVYVPPAGLEVNFRLRLSATGTAALTVHVVDGQTGTGISGADVNISGGYSASGPTDAFGYFTVASMPAPNTVDIQANMTNYTTAGVTGVSIGVGDIRTVDITLNPIGGGSHGGGGSGGSHSGGTVVGGGVSATTESGSSVLAIDGLNISITRTMRVSPEDNVTTITLVVTNNASVDIPAFELWEMIPASAETYADNIEFGIEPREVNEEDGVTAIWEFAGLQQGESITIIYQLDHPILNLKGFKAYAYLLEQPEVPGQQTVKVRLLLPDKVEVGKIAEFTVVNDKNLALSGVDLEVVTPLGNRLLVTTDEHGTVNFIPDYAGFYTIEINSEGYLLTGMATIQAVEAAAPATPAVPSQSVTAEAEGGKKESADLITNMLDSLSGFGGIIGILALIALLAIVGIYLFFTGGSDEEEEEEGIGREGGRRGRRSRRSDDEYPLTEEEAGLTESTVMLEASGAEDEEAWKAGPKPRSASRKPKPPAPKKKARRRRFVIF